MSTSGLTFNWETEKLSQEDRIVAQGERYESQFEKTEEEFTYTSMAHLANKKNLVNYLGDDEAASAITGFWYESAEVSVIPTLFLKRFHATNCSISLSIVC